MIFLSAGVAQHKGFFKDEGLDADIVVMGAAPSIAALSNGDIEFTLLTGTVIRAAIRGLPVRLVAGLMTSSPHVLLARPEIKSIPQFVPGICGTDVCSCSRTRSSSPVRWFPHRPPPRKWLPQYRPACS